MAEEAGAPGWYPDPWDSSRARWWDGTGWTSWAADLPGGDHGRPRSARPWTERVLVAIAICVGCVIAASSLLYLLVPVAYGLFGDDTWRARVTSVEAQRVCTTPDEGEEDPGWADPFCFDDGLTTEGDDAVEVQVGDCVEIESSHPAFYVRGIVDCAPR